MAVHKVPQDVEADDKFLGPLSFKQFVFFGITLTLGYVLFLSLTKDMWPLMIVVLPFFLAFGALAVPWSKDQPTEIWLASRIRFFLVPRRRIWNQSGIKNLVTITVPRREVHIYSDGLSQDQVRNRLSALASVIDSRGWAVKNVMATAGGPTVPMPAQIPQSDRLVSLSDAPIGGTQPVSDDADDPMDEQQSPLAQQFNNLIDQSTEKHRQETLAKIQEARLRHNVQGQPSPMSMLPPVMAQSPKIDVSGPNQPEQATLAKIQEARQRHTIKEEPGPTLPNVSNNAPAISSPGYAPAKDAWFLKQQPTKDPALASFQDTAVVQPGASGVPAIPTTSTTPPVAKEDEDKLLEHVKEKKRKEREQRSRSHEKVLKPLAEIEEEERQKAIEEANARAEAEARAREQAQSQPAPTGPQDSSQPAVYQPPNDPVILKLASNDDLNVETIARQAQKDKLDEGDEVVISLR